MPNPRTLLPLLLTACAGHLPATTTASTCTPPLQGAASLAWTVTNTSAQPIACAHVGALTASLLLHSASTGDTELPFPCAAGAVTTPLVDAGTYDATLMLRAAGGALVAAGPTQPSLTIIAGQITALAPVVFALDPQGPMILSLAAIGTHGNCAGGAGITGNRVTIAHAGGGCAPFTLTRMRGGVAVGTYVVVCSSPQIATCIETDETLSVTGVASGPYVVSAAGLIGPIGCWSTNEAVEVAAGTSLVHVLQLEHQANQGC